jgi:hypothetical protein
MELENNDFLHHKGYLYKKSPSLFTGFQKRWFQIENNGTQLTYYESSDKTDKIKGEIGII